ncbi:MAG: hypothetical protein WC521_00010 [Bdellovibrionales bacterium]
MQTTSQNVGQELVTSVVESEWGQHVLKYIDAKVGYAEQNRDSIFETLNNIHWAVRQVLRFVLDEDIIQHLYRRLDYMGGYLSWQIPSLSLTKTVLHQDRMILRATLMERLLGLLAEGKLRQPQNFIRFDSEGQFLSAARANVVRTSFASAEAVALLYDMHVQGMQTREVFVSRLVEEHPRCFLPLKDEVIIACGDAPLHICCGPEEIPDFAQRKFSVAWWLDVNFPADQLGDYPYIAARIPSFVRALLQKGEARLFLCAAGDISYFGQIWYDQVTGLAQHLGCKPESIVYLPQNSGFANDFALFVTNGEAKRGVPQIIPLNTHLLLASMQQPARIGETPSKKFLCFNHWPHIHRTALFLSMVRDGMLSDSHVSFNHSMRKLPEHFPKVEAAKLVPWMGMPESDVAALIEEVEPKLPLRLDLNDNTASPGSLGSFIWRFDARLHEDAAYYLVTESEMGGVSPQRFTEKTVKGLAAMNPFILFGNVGTLATLHKWGFQTFSPLIDESYDGIVDPVARFHAAYAEVQRLHALPMEQLLEQRRSLFPVLEHNRQRLLNVGSAFLGILQKGLDAA